MSSVTPNMFTSLHKWAKKQDENFCTEGLIYVIRLLLVERPKAALDLIRLLTNGLIGSEDDRAKVIRISGQIVCNRKRPDIQISCGEKIAWIEVKVDSPVADRQLANYRTELLRRTTNGSLSLLWRGGDPLAVANSPDQYVRWINVSDCLRLVVCPSGYTGAFVDEVIHEYVQFLESRQLAMSPISSAINRSLQDVACLTRLLGELLNQTGHQPAKKSSYSNDPDSPYLGRSVYENGKAVGSIGVHLFEPQWLFFTTDGHDRSLKLDTKAAERLVDEGVGDMSGPHWTLSVDLTDAPEFLSRNTSGQIAWLRENLLDPALAAARQILGLS